MSFRSKYDVFYRDRRTCYSRDWEHEGHREKCVAQRTLPAQETCLLDAPPPDQTANKLKSASPRPRAPRSTQLFDTKPSATDQQKSQYHCTQQQQLAGDTISYRINVTAP